MIDPILFDPKWAPQLADVLGNKYTNFLAKNGANVSTNDPEIQRIIDNARRELARMRVAKESQRQQQVLAKAAKTAAKMVAVFDANGKLIGVCEETKIQPLASQPVAKGRQVADPQLVAAIVEARKLAARDQRRLPAHATQADRDSAEALSTIRARMAGRDAAKIAGRRPAPNPGRRGGR